MEAEKTAVLSEVNTAADIDLLIRQLLNIGEAMYCAGSEIGRIEDTIHRLGKAYGADHVNVYVITSSIILTMEFAGYPATTQSRRIRRYSADLKRIERLNDLCRKVSDKPIPVAELHERVLEILKEEPSFKLAAVGQIFGAACFAGFFGGGFADFIAAALGGVIIVLLQKYLRPLCSGRIYFNAITSFIVGSAVCLLARLCPFLNADAIMIGDIMILIPGIGVTNAIRFTISGDTISGLEKLEGALLQAIGIAAGFTLAIYFFR